MKNLNEASTTSVEMSYGLKRAQMLNEICRKFNITIVINDDDRLCIVSDKQGDFGEVLVEVDDTLINVLYKYNKNEVETLLNSYIHLKTAFEVLNSTKKKLNDTELLQLIKELDIK